MMVERWRRKKKEAVKCVRAKVRKQSMDGMALSQQSSNEKGEEPLEADLVPTN